MERKRIAIVGSGISGLAALWTLRNSPHEVYLFEAEERLGGHTNTVTWKGPNSNNTPVDTGFIVLNTATYPNFIEFLKELNVKTIASEMTFGVSRDKGAFEWSGTSGAALFAQRSNILKPSFWRMIFDIIRFNQCALSLLTNPPTTDLSIGEYLKQEGYSDAFRDDYLIPMTACVWSTGPDKCALQFPALTLIRFMWNHHLLSTISERPPWLTVEGGSKKYIDAVISECSKATVYLGASVTSTIRREGRVELRIGGRGGGRVDTFDEVVLACHGDQARELLEKGKTMEGEERRILQAFETTPNIAYLHSDLALMPQRRTAWAAWNYLTSSPPQSKSHPASSIVQAVSLSYNMNILQSLPTSTYGNIIVTLNPLEPPSPALTQATYKYRHPLYNAGMVAAQEELEKIQGKRGIWYAGAWTGYGFHEDGFTSGMQVGLRLGGTVPWEVKNAKFSRGKLPVFGGKDLAVRFVITVLQLCINILERLFSTRRTDGLVSESTASGNGHAISNGKAKAS